MISLQKTGLLLGLVLIVLIGPVMAAFQPPKNEGYVTDLAGVLSPEAEQRIEGIAEELDLKTQTQIAVLTLPREQLGNIPGEEAALITARTWGVGSKKAGNTGLLIFMAVSDKPGQSILRTEIGYGLEGIITDGTSGQIQDEFMIPAFRQGDVNTGLVNGVAAYASLIAQDKSIELTSLSGETLPRQRPQQQTSDTVAVDGFLQSALVMFIFMAILAIAFVALLGKLFHSPYDRRQRHHRHDDGGLLPLLFLLSGMSGHHRGGGGFGGGGFGGFGGGGFGGGGSSRNW